MTSIQTTTTKTNHYFRALTALVALAMLASALMLTQAAKPVHAAAQTFTVNSNGDLGDVNVGDGICDDASTANVCTLRAAIQESNATNTTDADTINFNIPEAFRDPNTGVATISPDSPLPVITDQVTIDGYTQPGAHPNTKTVGNDSALKIELTPTNLFNGNGLEIQNSSGSVIRGLVISRFSTGVSLLGTSAVGNRIEGNFIGTDPTGTIGRGNRINGVSIRFGASQTVVGGTTPAARNVISGNETGINVFTANGNRIQGNYVGTDKSGTKDLGNTDDGVDVVGATGTTVGGTTAASRNVISGNDTDGLYIPDSQGTKLLGNRIGTTASGTGPLGNSFFGVHIIAGSSDNLIGDGTSAGSNTLAFNGQDGVFVVDSSIGNEVSRNSIFSNGGLGIDLEGEGEGISTNVSTPNDGDDPNTPQVDPDSDIGANNLQNKPVLSSAKTSSTRTTVAGKLNSTPGKTFTVRFFSNPSGTDEGKKFFGQKSVTTDGSGNASFTFSPTSKVAAGRAITATATSSGGDTSEFSAPKKVVAS
jgi:hypothetical protein